MTDNKHTPGELYYEAKTGGSIGINYYIFPITHPVFFTAENPLHSEPRAKRVCAAYNEHDQLKAENEKVKRLLHDLTPGGSEFYNDPEYCAKWIREEREECAALQRGTIKELKAELEAAKQREAKLREALQPLANLDLTGVTGSIIYQRDSTYIKVADVQKAKEALNQ